MRNIEFNSVYSDYILTDGGVEMDFNEFITMGMIAWEKIGNRNAELKCDIINSENNRIELPCDIVSIEGVFLHNMDYHRHTALNKYNYREFYIENYIEMFKRNQSLTYKKGELLQYRIEGNELVFDNDYKDVVILYYKNIVDQEGLPYLNYKEADAISAYCLWRYYWKKGLAVKDQFYTQTAMELKREWGKKLVIARTPINISQNDMDKVLDVKVSANRKQYGISFKLNK